LYRQNGSINRLLSLSKGVAADEHSKGYECGKKYRFEQIE